MVKILSNPNKLDMKVHYSNYFETTKNVISQLKMFKIIGIIVLTGFLFQKYIIYFTMVPALFVAFYLVVYSYVEYQKEKKQFFDLIFSERLKKHSILQAFGKTRPGGQPSPVTINGLYGGAEAWEEVLALIIGLGSDVEGLSCRIGLLGNHVRSGMKQH